MLRLVEMMGDFNVIEEEWQEAEWLERVLHVAIAKTRKDVHSPIMRRIALCKKMCGGPGGRAGEAGKTTIFSVRWGVFFRIFWRF